jgi:hypothetical protein
LNRRHSVQHPAYGNGDRSVRAADHAPRSAGFLEREDDTLGEDYRAYISAVSPRSIASKDSADAEFFSLGSDSRLRTGNSEMRHNEDIADRNVEHYGNKSSRPSSLGSQHAVNQIAQDHHCKYELESLSCVCISLGPTNAEQCAENRLQPPSNP